mmetsp:Transcript_32369/g.68096  ORF Transcript_32369/g.68096 Transcript_32369/m.68096 type:complete len:89 (-) Transcript_32369:151-417(-)
MRDHVDRASQLKKYVIVQISQVDALCTELTGLFCCKMPSQSSRLFANLRRKMSRKMRICRLNAARAYVVSVLPEYLKWFQRIGIDFEG